MKFKWRDWYARYINLSFREDRNLHMVNQLSINGLNIERFDAIVTSKREWDQEKYGAMLRRTPNACGCHESQITVMQDALKENKCAAVFEDDCVFCSDIIQRLDYIQEFLNKQDDWDVFWMGATFHNEPIWHKIENGAHTNPEIIGKCNCTLNKDWEPTEDKRIVRTYGIWSTYSYIVNVKSIPKILKLLEENIHLSIGIDFEFIMLQPQLKTFALLPGSVKQMDNLSNIGTGWTMFSQFAQLGSYWYQEKMEDYNP